MFNSYQRYVEEDLNIENTDKLQPQTNKNIFVQAFNPMLGKMEWKSQPEDYDYQQEVARAAFADMLHDSERNQLYYQGLKSAIEKKRKEGEKVHVLDIGTGTGLLAMMGAKLGADEVTAIEEFAPMYRCAKKIIEANGFGDKIKLIGKRSTRVKVSSENSKIEDEEFDMKERANILVTEVFDTELIGEAAIATFNHAHKFLLTKDCIVVPSEGVMYAQVVNSDVASKWNSLHTIFTRNGELGKFSKLEPPSLSSDAESYSLALHDLQLSQLKPELFKPITDPIKVFHFDFNCRDGKPIPLREQTVKQGAVLESGQCDAIFMWWDISMDLNKVSNRFRMKI